MKIVDVVATHSITDINELGFSPFEYSLFKYGNSIVGKKYGEELYQYFMENYGSCIQSYDRIVIFSSPYDYLPTASLTLTEAFYSKFVHYSKAHSLELVFGKVNRNTTYTVDYGALSASERLALISGDTFSLDTQVKSSDLLLFFDDIRITGSHQKVMENLLNQQGITNDLFFLYFAKVENEKIEPSFENYLNYYALKSFENIIDFSKQHGFQLNTRFTKYLLSLPENKFKFCISKFASGLVEDIKVSAINNSYTSIDSYKKNLSLLFQN